MSHDTTPEDAALVQPDLEAARADGLPHQLGAVTRLLRAVQAICESKTFSTAERVILIHLCVSVGALDFDRALSVGHTIAHYEMSGRTVRGALHRLTDAGYIITTARTGLSSLYRVSSHKLLADGQEGC